MKYRAIAKEKGNKLLFQKTGNNIEIMCQANGVCTLFRIPESGWKELCSKLDEVLPTFAETMNAAKSNLS